MPHKCLRNIRHNGDDYAAGAEFPDDVATKDQIDALVASGALASPEETPAPKKGKKGSE